MSRPQHIQQKVDWSIVMMVFIIVFADWVSLCLIHSNIQEVSSVFVFCYWNWLGSKTYVFTVKVFIICMQRYFKGQSNIKCLSTHKHKLTQIHSTQLIEFTNHLLKWIYCLAQQMSNAFVNLAHYTQTYEK